MTNQSDIGSLIFRNEIMLPADRVHPIGGWPLEHIGRIEQASPGFVWAAMHRSMRWRQAFFSLCAAGVVDEPAGFLLRACGEHTGDRPWADVLVLLGEVLLKSRPRLIVEATFGECPEGLMGTLGRLGFNACQPEVYARLHCLFAADDPRSRAARKCLRELSYLSGDILDVIDRLDDGLLRPAIVSRLADSGAAEKLNAEVRAVQLVCGNATDNAVVVSIENDKNRYYPDWVWRWLVKADRAIPPELPCDAAPFLERVTPATARKFGKLFSNCLGTDSTGALLCRMAIGRVAMVAWVEAGLLIELVQLDTGWMASRIHNKHNASVRPEHRRQVREALGAYGVFVPVLAAAGVPELEVLQSRFAGGEALLDLADPEG